MYRATIPSPPLFPSLCSPSPIGVAAAAAAISQAQDTAAHFPDVSPTPSSLLTTRADPSRTLGGALREWTSRTATEGGGVGGLRSCPSCPSYPSPSLSCSSQPPPLPSHPIRAPIPVLNPVLDPPSTSPSPSLSPSLPPSPPPSSRLRPRSQPRPSRCSLLSRMPSAREETRPVFGFPGRWLPRPVAPPGPWLPRSIASQTGGFIGRWLSQVGIRQA